MIVPMKKVQIAVLKEDYDIVIKRLQQCGLVMAINKEGGDSNPSLEYNEALQQRVLKTLTNIKKYEEKKPMFSFQTAEFDDFKEISKDSIDLLKQIEVLFSTNEELSQKIKENKELLESLSPWVNLDIDVSMIKDTKYTCVNIGYIPKRNKDRFEQYMKDKYVYQFYGQNSQCYSLIAYCYYEDKNEFADDLKTFEFIDYTLPNISYKINDYYNEINNNVINAEKQYDNNLNQIKELTKRSDELRMLSDQLLTQDELNNLRFAVTRDTKIIEGWVRCDEASEVEPIIKSTIDTYLIEISDPLEGDAVPTYTKNNKFASQFEQVTDMFSKPSIFDIDPNPVMSVWYWFLFGMMMGDAGYGILMLLGGALFKKIAKPTGNTLKLVNIITYSGIPTIFWGIIFGSYFGLNPQTDLGLDWWWYWFAPMDEPIQMLLVSVVIGALHLITGLIVKSIICIKNRDFIELFAKNISWILILTGIGLYFISSTIGIICAGTGVALVILFAGARKKSIIGKALYGILGLYDVTSYLGDVLSYSRIMALAMSSAAVAMVMNTLAKMVNTSAIGLIFAALIFVAGHIFNIVLGLLSAYVHDARLQYIEFFGKFFEGGGIDFKPLSLKTKYIKQINNIK